MLTASEAPASRRGDAADGGTVGETSWDAVTVAWHNGRVAKVHPSDDYISEVG